MATLDQTSPVTDSPSTAVHASAEQATDSQRTISKASRKKRDRGGSNENDSNRSKTSAPPLAPKSQKARRTSISRLNAQTHGIFSKAIILQRPECGERQEDFDALLAQFRKQMTPVGIQEELLVEFMVGSVWRYRRALKAEAGLLDQRAGLFGPLAILKKSAEANEYFHERFLCVKPPMKSVDPREVAKRDFMVRQKARNNSYCLIDLVACVKSLIAKVSQSGTVNESESELLQNLFGVENHYVLHVFAALDEAKESNGNLDVKEKLLKSLNGLCESLNDLSEISRLVEKEQIAIATRANLVPDESAMDRILRYQTTMQRDFYRAMQQLERLQRMRKGEHVPAPITFA